jgi:RNA polymerase sigma factor (sigma-70 family)
MPASPEALLHHLRRLATPTVPATDANLLERFVRCRDEEAFAAIVGRHGPLVYGVCRRLLTDADAVDDCFQATFLVLARRAASVQAPEALAGWLYGVSRRIARKARARHPFSSLPGEHLLRSARRDDPLTVLTAREVLDILDEEMHRLPTAYRLPLVFCCLEGLSQEEAAQRLGWTPGSVKGRLERGRKLLHDRLAKRGLAPAAVLAMAEVSRGTAGVPAALAAETVRAALTGAASSQIISLAEAAAQGVVLARFRLVLVTLVLLTVGVLGAGLATTQPPATEPPAAPRQESERPKARPSTDLHGDPLPAGAPVRVGTLRWRHHHSTADLTTAFSPDGKTVITGGDGTLKWWDTATGKLLLRLPGEYAGRLLLSPHGKWLVVASGDLLDATSGRPVRRLGQGNYPLAFSPDSALLATSADKGTVLLWNARTGEVLQKLGGQEQNVICGAFTPDGRTLVTLSFDKKVCHWDVATGALRRTITLSIPGWRTLDLSSDGRTLAVSGAKTVGLWDTTTGAHLGNLGEDAAKARYGLAFSPDGRTLATDWYDEGTGEARICLWDVAGRKLLRRFSIPARALGHLFFAPDNRTLASSGFSEPRLRLWDTTTGKPLHQQSAHDGAITGLAFTPDGGTLLSGSSDGTLRVWDAGTGRAVRELPGHPGGVSSLASTPDGRAVLSGGYDAQLLLQDWQTGKELHRMVLVPKEKLSPNVRYGPELSLAPDGRTAVARIGTAGGGALVYLWNLTEGRELARREDDTSRLVLSPDARILAAFARTEVPARPSKNPNAKAGDTDVVGRQLILHDAATGRRRLAIPLPELHGDLVAFSPDGRTVVTEGFQVRRDEKGSQWEKYTFRLWELATGRERLAIRSPKEGDSFGFDRIAFSPDGRTLATARQDRTIQVWDVATGAELLTHSGYEAAVHCLAFRPDGKALTSGHADSTILLWDLPVRRPRPSVLTPKQLEQAWADLASADAHKAHAGIWKLGAAPEGVVPFFRSRLSPAPPVAEDELRKLLADLDSESYERREATSRRLTELLDVAEPELEKVLQSAPSAEKRRRIEQILSTPRVVRAPDLVRALRAVEVLERVGSEEARHVIEALARGAAAARLTREARAALDRLAKRPPSP